MTNREFYSAVISAKLSAEMTEHATKCIEALDRKNASKASATNKDKVAVADRRSAVLGSLGEVPMSIGEVAALCGVSEGQARAALSVLVKDGKVVKSEVKNPTTKGKTMVYALAEV